jgi:ABC-type glutathione transport system ATPase component
MYLADRVVLLQSGQLVADAAPDKIVPQILKAVQTPKIS